MPTRPIGSFVADFRPEAKVLLCCARTSLDADTAARLITLLASDIEWPYLLRQARRHGLLPLLYWHLHRLGPDAVPAAIVDRLRHEFYNSAGRNLLLTNELLQQMALLQQHQIPALCFKGPTLAVAAYGNLSLRPFNDLDILVRRCDALRAREVFLSQGYRPATPLCRNQETGRLRSGCAFDLIRDDGKVMLDLHWAFAGSNFPFALAFEHLQPHLQLIDLAGTPVPTPATEDMLLILCVHGIKHAWARLEWIGSVAELIKNCPHMNWTRLHQQAAAQRSERMLAVGLVLAGELLHAPLPITIFEQASAMPGVREIVARVQRRLFEEITGSSSTAVDELLIRLLAIQSWPDRSRHALHFAICRTNLTARDRALLRLPRSVSFLYHLLRPLRLICEYRLSKN